MVKSWVSTIERKVTVGNVATIIVVLIAWTVSGAVWYTQVGGHLTDAQIHPTLEQRQDVIDARVHLLTDTQYSEINRRLAGIEDSLAENTKVLYEVKGRLPKEK